MGQRVCVSGRGPVADFEPAERDAVERSQAKWRKRRRRRMRGLTNKETIDSGGLAGFLLWLLCREATCTSDSRLEGGEERGSCSGRRSTFEEWISCREERIPHWMLRGRWAGRE